MHSIILSISADIGNALAERRLAAGHRVSGTFRSESDATRRLADQGATLFHADFAYSASVTVACQQFEPWDELIVAVGTLEPVGLFEDTDFGDWIQSLQINLIQQLHAVHSLLPIRNGNASLLFFAGGGSNGAPVRNSAYTLSKIALTKTTELLAAEMPDLRVTIVGPGWVKTKIHEETLRAGEQAGQGLQDTMTRLETDNFVPMDDVLDCIDWLHRQPRDAVSGRNFSVAHDAWGNDALSTALAGNPNFYKLRRAGNDLQVGS